jgi:glutamate/tyrosine decarboxylase-like PLP-dependent enzyme
MANFTGLAAGRGRVLADAGWDVDARGLAGGPRVRVLVGADRHATVDLAARYLGLGTPEAVAADDQGRLRPDALADALAAGAGPTIVCLQAGNLHSGAFDPLREAVAVAHRHGAWVHVDGAFGLWAAATPSLRHLTDGLADADSWATDAHKTLNVPYDCGISIVADPTALRTAMGVRTSYLVQAEGAGHRRRHGRRGERRDPQRRRLHPGLRRVRRRRPYARGGRPAAGRRHGLDVGLALARPGGAARVGQQLVHRRQ